MPSTYVNREVVQTLQLRVNKPNAFTSVRARGKTVGFSLSGGCTWTWASLGISPSVQISLPLN